MKMDRREFVKNTALLAVLGWVLSPFRWMGSAYAGTFKTPAPAGKNVADPSKGQAKNMHYVNFSSEFDKKAPNYAKISGAKGNCTNCNYFKPDKAGDAWGKCAMVANAYVYQEGVCQMWMKKPGA